MKKRSCTFCKKLFFKYAKPASNYFCSSQCYHKWKYKEKNPNWRGGGLKFKCIVCKIEFNIDRSSFKCKKLKGKFCSKKCVHFYWAKNKMSERQKLIAKNSLRSLRRGVKLIKTKIDWELRFGYTPIQFKNHFEHLFKKGMNWNNYGEWVIDHIRPTYLFRFKSINNKEFKKCFSLKNLQPLWAKENMIKGKNYESYRV